MKFKIILIYIILNFCKSYAKIKAKDLVRIVGGERTSLSKVGGFIVAMKYNDGLFCSGSYVAKLFVVSAAHCLHDIMDSLDYLTIQGGITALDEDAERIHVSHAVIPKEFTPNTMVMDVAVLKLRKPIKSPLVRFIKLCSHNLKVGDLVRVSGWGYIDQDSQKIMNHLRSVEVPALSKKECRMTYKHILTLSRSMICAGKLGEKDACANDSGGPLVHKNELCGIVSFGVGCADKTFPGVYTDVNIVKAFIRRTIEDLS